MPDTALSNLLSTQAATSGVGIFAQRGKPEPGTDPPADGTYPYAVGNLFLFDFSDDNIWAQALRWELDVYGVNDAAEVWDACKAIDAKMRGWRVQDSDSSVGFSTVLVRESAQPIEEPLDDKIIRVRVVYTAYYGSVAVAGYLQEV